ncbi:MAG: PHP domain-containing protein, partial [Candidatus Paceibacterota bacterium]
MINKHKELGIEYFACTDHASLTGALKAYIYAEKVGIKPILGMEIYFKDNNCDIVRDTESANIKYFKLILHAKDQEAYQKLVKKISTVKSKIFIQDKEYPSFDWNDLEELSKYNFTVATSDVECMVSKHLLIGR